MSRQERHQSKTNRRRKGLLWSLCLLVTLGLLAGGWVGYAAWSKQASQEQPPAGQAPTPEPSPSPTAPAKPSDTQDPDPSTTDPVPASPAPTEPTDPAPAQEDPSPPTHIQGVIEGFYGTPWSQETRIEMMGFLSTHHFNTYVYAPKDDPYQRARWGDLYPAAQAKQMQALIQAAANNGVDFVYSISPGIPQPLPDETLTQEQVAQSISFTSEQDYDRLSAKLAQLQGLGVHTFLLSFDDVERRVKAADQTVYGSNYAQAHIDLANRLLHAGRQQDPQFRLWFAPTTYYGLQDSPYWQAIRSSLDPSIPVIWTGEWVLNKAIGSEQADQVAQLIGRKPLLWDNYPVNDWTYAVQHQPQLLMGPLEHRASDLPAHLDGYLTNPMIQPEASKVALATIGDYLHDPSGYNANPDAFWEQSIRELNGNGDANALLTFCRFSSESSLTDINDPAFNERVRAYWNAPTPEARTTAAKALRTSFQTLSALPQSLADSLGNATLLQEITPWADKLSRSGTAGLLALDYLQRPADDPQKAALHQQLQTQLQALHDDSHYIGHEVIDFLDRAVKP